MFRGVTPKEYVAWLSKLSGKTYRLLTEAEWEYATRAGTTTAYSFGNEFSKAKANNDKGKTVPVGQYPANAFGLHDMHGNVWEWVEDCYKGSYAGAPADGRAVADAPSCGRVLRGGSWGSSPQDLRSAIRIRDTTDNRFISSGFRLARTLNP
jgi:formylglycine-generating enzyme required for sulfatase activity